MPGAILIDAAYLRQASADYVGSFTQQNGSGSKRRVSPRAATIDLIKLQHVLERIIQKPLTGTSRLAISPTH